MKKKAIINSPPNSEKDEVVVLDDCEPRTTINLLEQLDSFKNQRHSLRISASNIAAMVGLHPFKDLVDLLLKLVYQGARGHALLQCDAALLDLELVSNADEAVLHQLINDPCSNKSVQDALQQVLNVKRGEVSRKYMASVAAAKNVKDTALKTLEQSKVILTRQQREQVQEVIRSAVDTGFGTMHEDEALNYYENCYCGTPVSERNEQVRSWPFGLAPCSFNYINKTEISATSQSSRDDRHVDAISESNIPTVIPLRPPEVFYWQDSDPSGSEAEENDSTAHSNSNDTGNNNDTAPDAEDCDGQCQVDPSKASTKKPNDTEYVSGRRKKSIDGPDGNGGDVRGSSNGIDYPVSTSHNRRKRKRRHEDDSVFFYILGCADGIRDEMIPNNKDVLNSDDDDDDSWTFRRVIVECKHRMKQIHPTPPLYEQLQAAVYCFMYNVEEADILQVLRSGTTPNLVQASIQRETQVENEGRRMVQTKIQVTTDQFAPDKNETPSAPDTATPEIVSSESLVRPKPIISVTRVSLNDPIMQHRHQFFQTVLPRLRSFVEAVYEIRSNDDKRYRFLAAASDPSDKTRVEQAWNMLHEECPWLASCDTAFHRK